ncbi:sensor histidine kinase [Pengzhenrongella sicca]|uniref:histidine kinase n=1 Tax=Pengzhenrongella sicca TaxID=2819238 RepID=A0A8A4ZEU2_9MICO|nr:histidine kinase [Pengzhenrongella sicca]QTE30500.1 hypothetical protein J4E96_05850 [Pengzhenrongella sicca]
MWLQSPDENRELRRQSLLIAGLCAVSDMILLGLALSAGDATDALSSPLTWIAVGVVLLADLALALPARTAGGVAVLHGVVRCASAALLWQATGIQDIGTGNSTGLAVAGYRAGAWTAGRRSWVALSALALGMTGAQLIQDGEITLGAVFTTVTNTVLPWLIGRHTTGRAGYIEQVERAAADHQRETEERTMKALVTERGAIARDLHDTISHHVSAIGIHAAAGRLALAAPDPAVDTGAPASPRRPREAATRALHQVETSSQAAMTDLRRMLDLLAGESSDGVRQPGLAELGALVDGSRRAGLDVALDVQGLRPSELPQSLQLSAYRIIQEILTNALRHGDGDLALSIQRRDGMLSIRAVNAISVSATSTAGSGHGLDGIRRRAEVFGGNCSIGPDLRARTWQTHVELPLETS